MRWTALVALTGLVIAGAATTASAVCVDSTVDYVQRGYHRNVLWPWPYVCPDRIAAREPFDIMIRNGWRRQNLLGSHYFNPATNQLTAAGELQVHWIMTQAPPARRQVFIERSLDPSVTAERLEATRRYATQVAIGGQQPQVFVTHQMAEGRPAATVDMVNVKFMENMPAPVLPADTTSDSGQ